MFTTHTTHRRTINPRLVAATALAGLIGTAGLAAAAATGGDDTTTPVIAEDLPATTTDAVTPGTTTPGSIGMSPGDSAPDEPADATTLAMTAATPTADAAENATELDPGDPGEEPDLPGTPGEITGPEPVDPPPPPPPGPSEFLAPVDKPDPPAPTVPGPTDLLPGLTDPDPDPTPIDGPTDFQVVPLPGYLGTITSGLSGCQLDCVTSAQLIANDFDPSVVLEVETTVPVHVEAEVTTTDTDSSAFFNGPGYDDEWSLQLTPLQPDTTYDLTMIVVDADGHSKVFEHQFTTVDVIDGLVGNAQGCALHCITEGSVDKTDVHATVSVHVETDSPARLDVWVSTSEPGWVGDTPFLPLEAKVYENANPSTSTTFDVTGLQADTTYHVIARAEDDWGVDHRIGTFHTDPAPPVAVTVTFEKIRVTYDGDKWSSNRGELSFAWGLDGYATGHRAEEKMHAGTDIHLSSNNSETFLLPADGWSLPWIGVSAAERDWDGLTEFCAIGNGVTDSPVYIADCDVRINVARTPDAVTQADVDQLFECSLYGITGDHADRKCLFLVAPDQGDEYAQFTAIVSIDAP